MAKILEMPKLSPTMEEGQLSAWHKKEGDVIAVDDLLAEVETDKATMEFRSFDKGTLLKLLVPAGSMVKLGQPVAIVGQPGEDISALAAGASQGGQAPAAPPPAQAPEGGQPQAQPQGQPAGQTADQQPAPPATPPAGAASETGTSGGYGGQTPPPGQTSSGSSGQPSGSSGQQASQGAPQGQPASSGTSGQQGPATGAADRVKASPYVRKLAREHDVDLHGVQGSGPAGRVIARDVAPLLDGSAKAAPPSPAAPGGPQAPSPTDAAPQATEPKAAPRTAAAPGLAEPEARPLSMMRKTIARRLTEAKQSVPHFYLTIDVDAGALVELREQVNGELAQGTKKGEEAPRVSLNDFLIKACAAALRRVPECNAQYTPDAILVHRRVDISVAVAVPEGLVTPVLRDADRLGVAAIGSAVRDLATRAKARKLAPEEMQNGTFSISNLGMFGIDEFAAVINPPEGAILAVGRVRDEPVVRGGQVVAGKRLALTLSCDHRVIDGAVGARFLDALRSLIERPMQILVA